MNLFFSYINQYISGLISELNRQYDHVVFLPLYVLDVLYMANRS